MPACLHFEDFRTGQIYSLGEHRITADEIIEFASEFDPQPQHLDPEAAKASILGALAASGWHLCALCMRMIVDGLFSRCASMGAPGVEEVQWRKPVYAGDVVQLEAEVDPSLIGGVVIRVGDRLIDGSTRSRLRSLRERLQQGAV